MDAVTHARLVAVLTAEDAKLCKRERHPNIHRLSHYFQALQDAEQATSLETGILDSFTHSRMRDALLRVIGTEPCKCQREGSCRLCR